MQTILHVGLQKTASSTIQTFLARNRTELSTRKVLYPSVFGENKSTLIADFLRADPGHQSEKTRANLQKEFSGDFVKAIISNENLATSEMRIARRLKDTLEPYTTSWRILCYVRRPDEHIVSQYQQQVRGGFVGTLDQFFTEQMEHRYYRYTEILDPWANIFGEDAVEVRTFHRHTLQGSPIEDFMQWAGLDCEGLSVEAQGQVKDSLDRLNTEILRFLRLCQVEDPDTLRQHDLKRMLHRLRALDTGARQRLDVERALRLHEQFRADHERLAQRYLSPEHAAVLLASPAEVPPQPPLDRDALFERMMALFGDADLARLAVAKADMPATFRRTPEKRLHLKKETRAERVMQRQEMAEKKRRAAQNSTTANAGPSKVRRTIGAGQSGKEAGGIIQRLWARLTSR